MTIKQDILDGIISATRERLVKLNDLSAPQVIIDRDQQVLDEALAGKVKVSDKQNLINLGFTNVEYKNGKGGKPYREYATEKGTVLYFPRARFGRFLTMSE